MRSFPFADYTIRAMTIERPQDRLKDRLTRHGYSFLCGNKLGAPLCLPWRARSSGDYGVEHRQVSPNGKLRAAPAELAPTPAPVMLRRNRERFDEQLASEADDGSAQKALCARLDRESEALAGYPDAAVSACADAMMLPDLTRESVRERAQARAKARAGAEAQGREQQIARKIAARAKERARAREAMRIQARPGGGSVTQTRAKPRSADERARAREAMRTHARPGGGPVTQTREGAHP